MLLHFPLAPMASWRSSFPLRCHMPLMKVAFLSLIVCYSKGMRGKNSQYKILSTFCSLVTCDRNAADTSTQSYIIHFICMYTYVYKANKTSSYLFSISPKSAIMFVFDMCVYVHVWVFALVHIFVRVSPIALWP